MKKLHRETYHKSITIRTKESFHQGMHVMVCPQCDKIAASASERGFLPSFTTCIGGQTLTLNEEVSESDKEFYRSLFVK